LFYNTRTEEIHAPNSEITSIVFLEDNRYISRADDNTMKIWDIRRPNKALYTWENIPCFSSKTGLTLNGDESIIMTGTCVKKRALQL